jgi:Rod binding domain-containing protein
MNPGYLPLQPILPPDPLGQAVAPKAASAANVRDRAKIEHAARDFESVLLHKVFEEMQRTVPESGLLETGTTEQVQSLFWFYLAQDVAAKGGIGLWKELARQMGPVAKEGSPDAPAPQERP